jgi:hypothetical protein
MAAQHGHDAAIRGIDGVAAACPLLLCRRMVRAPSAAPRRRRGPAARPSSPIWASHGHTCWAGARMVIAWVESSLAAGDEVVAGQGADHHLVGAGPVLTAPGHYQHPSWPPARATTAYARGFPGRGGGRLGCGGFGPAPQAAQVAAGHDEVGRDDHGQEPRSNHRSGGAAGCRTTRVCPGTGSRSCQLQLHAITSPRWRQEAGRCLVDRSTSSRSGSSRCTLNEGVLLGSARDRSGLAPPTMAIVLPGAVAPPEGREPSEPVASGPPKAGPSGS